MSVESRAIKWICNRRLRVHVSELHAILYFHIFSHKQTDKIQTKTKIEWICNRRLRVRVACAVQWTMWFSNYTSPEMHSFIVLQSFWNVLLEFAFLKCTPWQCSVFAQFYSKGILKKWICYCEQIQKNLVFLWNINLTVSEAIYWTRSASCYLGTSS